MPTQRNRWILILLAVAALASLSRTVVVEHQKREISRSYQQAQQLAAQLSAERNHLNQELSQAQQTVEGQTGELSNLKQELTGVQDQLDETIAQLSSLQREHETLREQHTSLNTQLASVTIEKEQLAAKLTSLQELRLAIRDVQRKIRDERSASWRAYVEAAKQADQAALASGNRGYMVHDGTPTMRAGTPRMNVHVLEPQSQ